MKPLATVSSSKEICIYFLKSPELSSLRLRRTASVQRCQAIIDRRVTLA